MTVIIIPHGNESQYMKIVGADNLETVSMTRKALQDIWSIAGNPETHILEGLDDWNGRLDELRKVARKQERRNKGTLISRLITYFGRRKNVSL